MINEILRYRIQKQYIFKKVIVKSYHPRSLICLVPVLLQFSENRRDRGNVLFFNFVSFYHVYT